MNFGQLILQMTSIGVVVIPFAMGIFAASFEPFWLDSTEFTAAVQVLGIPHPPGHPLYVLLTKLFTVLPIGTISFRVAVGSAFYGSLACLLFFKLAKLTLFQIVPNMQAHVVALVAFAATLILAASTGFWFQCVRAEVYSLQILLVLGVFYPLVLFDFSTDKKSNLYLLYFSAFLFGLGLSNHHFIMLSVLPAAVPVLVSTAKQLKGRGTAFLSIKLMGIVAFALLPYILLPIRSYAGAPISLGGVHTLGDFWWVVSAKVYQKSMVKDHMAGLDARTLDAVFTTMKTLGPATVIASLAGLYLLFRKKATRLIALVFLLIIFVPLLLRSIMGFDPYNPDYYGYILPVLCAMVVLSSVFVGVALHIVSKVVVRFSEMTAVGLALALFCVPVLKIKENLHEVDLSDFRATRLMYDVALEDAEPESLILASYYNLFFVLWSMPLIDGSRPDVVVANPNLLGYPGYRAKTLHDNPFLTKLAHAMMVHGKITESTVSQLAMDKPLRVEPNPWLADDVNLNLIPDGPLYRGTSEPLARRDFQAAYPDHQKKWRGFYATLGAGWRQRETGRMLSWTHYLDALFMARHGAREEALSCISRAKAIGSKYHLMLEMEKKLKVKGESGALDVRQYIPQKSRQNASKNINPHQE